MPPRTAFTALVIALLPAMCALSEVLRGTRSSGPWHPLGVIAFVYACGVVLWICLRQHSTVRVELVSARENEESEGGPAISAGRDKLGPYGDVPSPPPSTNLLAVALFMFALLAVHPVLFDVLMGGWKLPWRLPVDADMLYYALSLALFIGAYLLLPRNPSRSAWLNLRWRWKPVDLAIGAAFGLLTFVVLRLYLQQLGGNHAPMEIFGVSRSAEPAVYFAVGALFTLVNALSEELWYRGLLLGALRGLLPLWPAVLLQALCFGLAHWVGTPQGWLGLTLAGTFGLALGWWTAVRGSLWPALMVHLLADWLIFAYTNG